MLGEFDNSQANFLSETGNLHHLGREAAEYISRIRSNRINDKFAFHKLLLPQQIQKLVYIGIAVEQLKSC